MKAQYENVPSPNRSFAVSRRIEPSFPFQWHYHPEFELTLIEDGCGQRFVGDSIEDYGPSDLVLIGANVPHTWKSNDRSPEQFDMHRAVVVQFRLEHLGKGLLDLEEMQPIAQLLSRAARGLHFALDKLPAMLHEDLALLLALPPARRTITLISILLMLAEDKSAIFLSSGDIQPLSRFGEERRMNEICLYLNRNLEKKISYSALARHVHMDQSSLCRFFKKANGRTITEYVNEIRVSNAARLLIETELSTLEIALATGFSNYSNFCKQFKKHRGRNPLAVRQLFRAAVKSQKSVDNYASNTENRTPIKEIDNPHDFWEAI